MGWDGRNAAAGEDAKSSSRLEGLRRVASSNSPNKGSHRAQIGKPESAVAMLGGIVEDGVHPSAQLRHPVQRGQCGDAA